LTLLFVGEIASPTEGWLLLPKLKLAAGLMASDWPPDVTRPYNAMPMAVRTTTMPRRASVRDQVR
jgi:hypothetical protein